MPLPIPTSSAVENFAYKSILGAQLSFTRHPPKGAPTRCDCADRLAFGKKKTKTK